MTSTLPMAAVRYTRSCTSPMPILTTNLADVHSKQVQSPLPSLDSLLPPANILARLLGWTAMLFAIQGWLSETPDSRETASQPAYFSVGMAVLSLGVVSSVFSSSPRRGRRKD